MKRLLNIITGLLLSIAALAQYDPQYSHNMFNQMTVNPGYAGSSDMIGINLLHRNQWMGVPGAPVNTVFSVNAPVNLFDKAWGAGLTILQNTQGIPTDLGLRGSFAYQRKVEIGDGKVGFGLSFGFINSSADWSKLSFGDANETLITARTKESKIAFDMGAGVYYKTDKVYLGVSTTHPITTDYGFTGIPSGAYSITPNFYITAGYYYQLDDPMYQLAPSVFLQTNAGYTTLNVNTNLIYNNRIWGGMSLRSNGDLTALFGLELMTGIKFGAAYDFSAGQSGSLSN